MEDEKGFMHLPTELQELILLNLKNAEQKVLRLVCTKWHEIIDKRFQFTLPLFDARMESFKAFDETKIIDELIVTNFQMFLKASTITRSGLSKNIRCMTFGNYENLWIYKARNHFISDPDYGIDPANVRTLLQMNPNIQELKVVGNFLSPGKNIRGILSLQGLRLQQLTVLEMSFGNTTRSLVLNYKASVEACIKLFQNEFPSLHTLNYSSITSNGDIRIWVALFQCIAANRRTLKRIKITHEDESGYIFHGCEPNNWFLPKKYDELRRCVREVNLESLILGCVEYFCDFGSRWRALEKDLIQSQKNLTIAGLNAGSKDNLVLYYGMILKSNPNLTEFTISWNCWFQVPFDCAVLSNCSKLERLGLKINSTDPGCHHSIEEFYQNIQLLPKSIVKFECGQMLRSIDALWIAQNLINLEEIVYSRLRNCTTCEAEYTFGHFRLYLQNLPSLKTFRIRSFRCPKIQEYVQLCPDGLRISDEPFSTNVTINRELLDL